MSNIFKDIFANIQTSRNKKEYEKAHERAIASSFIFHALFSSNPPPDITVTHPAMGVRVKMFKEELAKLSKVKPITVNFGDSLTDLSRKYIDSIDGIFSISGSWHYHMSQTAEAMQPEINEHNVENVVVGCLGGNPFLLYQDLSVTTVKSLKALDDIKAIFPNRKFIVYGLPPTYNLHLTETTYSFDASLINWCKNNGGVFISLKGFGGFFGLFPKTKWSNDGVHFTPKGARRFSKAVETAKSATPGTVVSA